MKEEILEKIVEDSYDAILVTDGSGVIIYANQATVQSFGLSMDEVIGRTPAELIEHGVYRNSTILKAIESGKTVTDVVQLPGCRRLSTSVPLKDESGKLYMVITNSRGEDVLSEFAQQLLYEQTQHARYREIADYLSGQKDNVPVYKSKAYKEIMKVCTAIADTDSTVMILGESGVGKEVLAKTIHNMSPRRDKAFIPVNCAAIPDALFESELFGYMPHAFTGASAKGKIGLIKAAEGGTIFLDEVAELPLPMQTKLLRFLATNEITPVGGETPETVDVRIITATNRDLLQMTRDKTFRLDLYYRLNVIPIQIPPLRERPEDVEVLAEYFLGRFNRKYKKSICLNAAEMAVLQTYEWPGNVRELRNIIERLVVVSKSVSVQNVLNNTLFLEEPTEETLAGQPEEDVFRVSFDLPLKQALEQFEDFYVDKVIEKNEGALGQAAKVLEIHRSTLYRKQKPSEA